MLRRRPETIVVLSFAAMFAVELLMHWALARDISPHLRAMYLSNSKLNSITMLVDGFLPSAILGLVSGWVGYQWTTPKLNLVAVLLALGVTCVHFVYHMFFPSALLWWWPPEWGEGLIWFGTGTIFALFFSHFGRNFHNYREEHAG
jgi:hypothetical protein